MREIVVSTSWRDRVDELIGGRREVWIIAAVLAAAVIGSLLIWMRGAPAVVAPPATSGAPAPAATPVPSSPPTSVIYVHVAGAVRKPGLYEFPSGTRVAAAIETAGGPTRRADLDAVNLAEVLTDGIKLEVPERGEAVVTTAAPGSATPGSSAAGLVSLNTADQATLETIPGVGPVTAPAIIQHRTEIGSFTVLEQLLDVTGIGPATLESLRPYVTL